MTRPIAAYDGRMPPVYIEMPPGYAVRAESVRRQPLHVLLELRARVIQKALSGLRFCRIKVRPHHQGIGRRALEAPLSAIDVGTGEVRDSAPLVNQQFSTEIGADKRAAIDFYAFHEGPPRELRAEHPQCSAESPSPQPCQKCGANEREIKGLRTEIKRLRAQLRIARNDPMGAG